MTLPAWITSRWVVAPVALALVIGAWNIYVTAHAHGRIEGRVVDATGQPVADATVTLYERGIISHTPKEQTRTDAAGVFRFTGNNTHAVQLQAEKPALGQSDRLGFRLWFRAQDLVVPEPLRLAARHP